MKPEILKAWIDALRSGRYEQCYGKLRQGDAFCALGVLCDVADPEGWKRVGVSTTWLHRGLQTRLHLDFAHEVGLLSTLEYSFGYHPETGGIAGIAIADLNDKQRLTFAEIADRLESYGCR